jgi:hypothetical protein
MGRGRESGTFAIRPPVDVDFGYDDIGRPICGQANAALDLSRIEFALSEINAPSP